MHSGLVAHFVPLASRLGCAASRLLPLASRLAVVTLATTACTVGPNYTRPEIDAPTAWRIEYEEAAEVVNTRWWEAFGDPALTQLVDAAVLENLDVQIAAARVDQFLGALRTTRSQFYPQFDYSAEASENYASRVGQPPIPSGEDRDYSLYTAALGASWQIDLFGRVRRQSEAAQARVYATEQARRGLILSVVTSVTTGYIVLRALDRQLEISQATAQNYAETLRLFELRFQGGVVSEVELAQIESQYQQALAAIPSLERQIALQENLLSILLGRNPNTIARGLAVDRFAEPGIPGGLPSSLLERRPDILQAEQQLRAANAEIGAARSLYYPTLSITGVLGLASTSLDDFTSGDAGAGYIAGGLFGPIFTFGRIEGQVLTAEAAQREALAFYRQVVLNAFRETNDALVGVQKKREEYSALAKRVEALRRYASLSRLRFDNGTASYLEVLYAENELFGAELAAVQRLSERYGELINVYKALGGGWVDLADPLAPGAAGPAVAEAASSSVQASEQDRMQVTRENGASIVNVHRVRGVGGAMVKAPARGWSEGLRVRFHGFPELESFTAKTRSATLQCELQRPEGRAPEHRCRLDGQDLRALAKAGGVYEITVPGSILTQTTPEIEMRWVDQWR